MAPTREGLNARIWDVETQRFLTGLTGHVNWVRWAEFDTCGRLAVSGGDDKTIRLWDVERHECVHTFCDISGNVSCTRFHPHGSCIGSSMAEAVQIWDIRSKMLIQHYAGNTGMVKSLCFHPSGNFLLSACDDCSLKLWDLREGKILCAIKGHEGSTTCAEFSPGGGHFASGSLDEQVILWQSNLRQEGCRAPSLGTFCLGDASRLCGGFDQTGHQIVCPTSSMSAEDVNPTEDDSCNHVPPCQEDDSKVGNTAALLQQDDCTRKATIDAVSRTDAQELPPAPAVAAEDIKSSLKAQLESDCAPTITGLEALGKLAEATAASEHIYVSLQDTKALGKTLEDLVNQFSTLTDTVSVFGDRLCHIENKVLQFEKRGSKSQQT